MRVDPGELRGAATKLDALGTDMDAATSTTVSTAGSGISWSQTSKALQPVDDQCTRAVDVLAGRMREMASVCTRSATEYRDTDVDAAKNLTAMGELNTLPPGAR